MTPAARLQAAIDLLDIIFAADAPADGAMATYFRQHRYIGAKDRRSVSDQVWRILRSRAQLTWALGIQDLHGRLLVAADLARAERKSPDAIAGLYSGAKNGPPPLSTNERRMVERASAFNIADAPKAVTLEMPDWLLEKFQAAFGEATETELAALGREAPLDIRVNALKATRQEVSEKLAEELKKNFPTSLSPLGLRLPGRTTLGNHDGFRDGLFDVQDEGSQLVAFLADAKPGLAVMDLCAGAGGKTLAMAAAMNNQGRLIACDVSVKRLERAKLRLRRAGVHNATLRVLDPSDKWIKRQSGSFDRVVIDAPCSGTGSWRRHPDARWRFTPEALANLTTTQDQLLDQGAALVKAGGRLVYITCSLLPEENNERIAAFLKRNAGFRIVPAPGVWRAVLPGEPPSDSEFLTLTPARTGTDGFFIAILERLA